MNIVPSKTHDNEKLSVNGKSTSFTERGWFRIAKDAITQENTELAPYFKGIESFVGALRHRYWRPDCHAYFCRGSIAPNV